MSYDMRIESGDKCGRCSWWEGSRMIDGANNLCLENRDGRCSNPQSWGGGKPQTSMHQGCSNFELWNRLR